MHRNTRHCQVKGVWSEAEHERFIEAMALFPLGPWKLITDHVGTRSIKQVQTHAQKYQQKLLRQQRGLRKKKTKLKQPEHRVDAVTINQFRHKSILRYAQRCVKQQDEAAIAQLLPASPVDATFVGFHLADAAFGDWNQLTADVDLLDLLPDEDVGLEPELDKQQENNGGGDDDDDDDEPEVPKFDAMYDPPSGWNEWQLNDLLQPPLVDTTLAADKGGHPDGSELSLLECTV